MPDAKATKTLVVRGHGDESFFRWGVGTDDFVDDVCGSGSVRVLHIQAAPAIKTCSECGAARHSDDSTEGMIVTGVFVAPSDPSIAGGWSIGIAPLDDRPLPAWAWPMRWSFEGNTTVLEMDIPIDATVLQKRSLGMAR